MAFDERATRPTPADRLLGLTAYGCDQDEAELFHELGPRVGIVPTTTCDAVSATGVISVPRNRCVSVGHTSELSGRELRALRAAGVEYVATRSIGVDHIDLDAAATLGISVEHVAYAPDGVADFTLMLLLMTVRHAGELVGTATWHDRGRDVVRGSELCELTVGVVGVGRIGQAVITRLVGFGCRVLACSSSGGADATGAERVTLDELLRRSDVVTLHVPLDGDTHHLIGRAQIDSMRRGALLVNTGRGALVDTDALIAALECGRLGGAALDVVEGEDGLLRADRTTGPSGGRFLRRLEQLPNVIVTPHVAYRTSRTLHEIVDTTLMNCLRFERNNTNDETQDRDPVRGLLGGA